MNSNDELSALLLRIKELFIHRMCSIYGNIPEFDEWEQCFDFADAHTESAEACALAAEAFITLIRTKHPDFIP